MARVLDDNSEVYNLSNLSTRIPIAWSVIYTVIYRIALALALAQ